MDVGITIHSEKQIAVPMTKNFAGKQFQPARWRNEAQPVATPIDDNAADGNLDE